MQDPNCAGTRQVVNANAVIVQNAYLNSVGPLSGTFEVFDPDYCVIPQADGKVRIIVNCSFKGDRNSDSDSTLELTAQQWDCLTVIGFEGTVVSEIVCP